MRRVLYVLVFALALTVVSACAPAVTVENGTSFPVRVIVAWSGGRSVLSPSPGESSSVEVTQGAYRATAIPDAEWIEYARLTRKVLNDRLANADQLTGPQLLDVIRRLKEIALQMQQFENAAGSGASCGGRITEESGGGLVRVSADAGGKLVIACK